MSLLTADLGLRRGRRIGRGRGCRCCRGDLLQISGWRIVARWCCRALCGLGDCGSLLLSGGICPVLRVSKSNAQAGIMAVVDVP